jgi:hypothetical protein
MTIRSIGPLLCGGLLVLAATTSSFAVEEKAPLQKAGAADIANTSNVQKQVPVTVTKPGEDTTLSGVKKVETPKQ